MKLQKQSIDIFLVEIVEINSLIFRFEHVYDIFLDLVCFDNFYEDFFGHIAP